MNTPEWKHAEINEKARAEREVAYAEYEKRQQERLKAWYESMLSVPMPVHPQCARPETK